MHESCDGAEGYSTRRNRTREEEVKSMIKAAAAEEEEEEEEEEKIGHIKRFRLALLAAVAIVGIVDIAMVTITAAAPGKNTIKKVNYQ